MHLPRTSDSVLRPIWFSHILSGHTFRFTFRSKWPAKTGFLPRLPPVVESSRASRGPNFWGSIFARHASAPKRARSFSWFVPRGPLDAGDPPPRPLRALAQHVYSWNSHAFWIVSANSILIFWRRGPRREWGHARAFSGGLGRSTSYGLPGREGECSCRKPGFLYPGLHGRRNGWALTPTQPSVRARACHRQVSQEERRVPRSPETESEESST